MSSSTLVQMRARFNSQCPSCSKRIRYDDRMVFDTDARIAYHPDCVPSAVRQAAPAAPAAPAAERMPRGYKCRSCGTRGFGGQYPFSTNPGSGLCDDCGA